MAYTLALPLEALSTLATASEITHTLKLVLQLARHCLHLFAYSAYWAAQSCTEAHTDLTQAVVHCLVLHNRLQYCLYTIFMLQCPNNTRACAGIQQGHASRDKCIPGGATEKAT